ncbi:MAG: phosphoribosylanthranilate isomerase [Syntrophomonadaceae bacterium]
MTLVKICGIKTIEEARAAREAGAWAVGLVFAPSKRCLDPLEAAHICSAMKNGPLKIGVFVNEELDTIRRIAALCGLDAVQLHGEENPRVVKQLVWPVIKSFPVDGPLDHHLMEQWNPWAYHFDSKSRGPVRGGTGRVFNWEHLAGLPGRERIIISGGLDPDNVGELINRLKPWAVDVSSGVEHPGGGKDQDAIFRFMARVREADAREADGPLI